MISAVLAVSAGSGFRVGLMAAAVGLGFRHGIDWDHIAAISDITGAQPAARRSMVLATLYALGHALVVLLLGVLAIVLSAEVPTWLDQTMERVVGVTLLFLGAYVVIALACQRREFRMRSRWMLLFAVVHRVARWARRGHHEDDTIVIVHEHDHPIDELHAAEHAHAHGSELVGVLDNATAPSKTMVAHRHLHHHTGRMPEDPLPTYGHVTAFSIGTLHGIGAETPTQVLLFLAAARAGGTAAGLLLLVCFLAGLVASNTLVASAATFGFLEASRHFLAYATTSVVIAAASLSVGALFVTGHAGALPAFAGG